MATNFYQGNEERERRRQIAQALISQGVNPQTNGGPFTRSSMVAGVGNALVGALMNRKLRGEETADRDAYNKTLAEALRGPQAPADGMGAVEDKNEFLIKTLAGNERTAPLALEARLSALNGNGTPAEIQAFNKMTEGFSEDDIRKARRVHLGLDPRPTSGFIDLGDRRVNPGTGQSFPVGVRPSDQPEVAAAKAAAEASARAGAENAAEKTKKVPALTNLEYLDTQFKDIQAKTSTGGPLGAKGIASRAVDYQSTQRFNNLREQISTELRTIFRIPGEGTLSDREMAQYGLQLPDIKNDPEINLQIMTDIKTRAGNRLGQGEGGDGNAKNWEDLK